MTRLKEIDGNDRVNNDVIAVSVEVPPVVRVVATSGYPWVSRALALVGTKELLPNGRVNPFVTECFSYTTYKTDRNEAWCAAFISYLMAKSGLSNKASAAAADWGIYGVKLSTVCYGAIVHIQHPGNHVTICVGVLSSREFLGLGGNQSNKVCIQTYQIADVRAVRWPTDNNGTAYPAITSATPNAGITLVWDNGTSERAKWTAHVVRQLPTLGKDMLAVTPGDHGLWHPNFQALSTLQRVEFYANLIAIMAKYESSFKPETVYAETGSLAGVISRGLLQISIDSANGYGCGLQNSEQLHDPYVSLNCGIIILNRWIGQRDKVIASGSIGAWRGGARYWSVLRDRKGSKAFPAIARYMNNLFKTA